MLLWAQKPQFPTYRIRTSISGALFRLKTPTTRLLPPTFSESALVLKSHFLWTTLSFPGRATTRSISRRLRQSLGFCRSKTLSCTSTDYQECRYHQAICCSPHTHHRCLYCAPSPSTESPLLGIPPLYYPLQLPCTHSTQAIYCRPVHCASSCIPASCFGCSQSNNFEVHISAKSNSSVDASYPQEAHSVGTLTYTTAATSHQPDCLAFPYSYNLTPTTLDYESIGSVHFCGTDEALPPPEELNAPHEWSTTSELLQGQPVPLANFEALFGFEGQYNATVLSSEPKMPSSSWSWTPPSGTDYELFHDTIYNPSNITIPPVTVDLDVQAVNTVSQAMRAQQGILTPQCDASLSLPPPSTRYQSEEGHSAFLFVDNSDKETAARLRNVLNNRKQRKHRKHKMSRVAELEGKLRAIESEKNIWKRKAEFWRKALVDDQS